MILRLDGIASLYWVFFLVSCRPANHWTHLLFLHSMDLENSGLTSGLEQRFLGYLYPRQLDWQIIFHWPLSQCFPIAKEAPT